MELTQERMTTILSTMAEGVVVHDAGGRIEWCNAGAERILGLAAGQMAGLTSLDPRAIREDGSPFPGDDQPAMVALRTGQPQAGVMVGVHRPDGSLAWLCVNSQALFENGKPRGVVTTFREVAGQRGEAASVVDITQRKIAEAALRDSARLNQQILDSAREGIIVYGKDLKYQVWNRHMEELSGVPASKVLGRHLVEVFPFLRQSGVVERCESILAGGESKEIDFPYAVPETGRSGWVSHVNAALRDESGEIVGVMATVKDITERKIAERQSAESEKRFHQLFDCAPISLWEADFSAVKKYLDQVDGNGAGDLAGYFDSHPEQLAWCVNQVKILDLNRATEELFEAENKAELLNRFRHVVTSSSLEVLRNGLVAVFGGQTRFRQEAAFRTLKGRPIICDVRVTPAPGFEDSWSIVLISAADITERKRAEAELAREKALSDAVINGLPGVFYMFDRQRRMVRWNEEFLNATGATAEQASRTIAMERIVDADKGKTAVAIETAFSAGQASVEARVAVKNGIRNFHFVARRLQTADGVYLLGSGYDITDRKRAEDALRQSEAKFRAVVENSHEGILFVDERGVIVYVGLHSNPLPGSPPRNG